MKPTASLGLIAFLSCILIWEEVKRHNLKVEEQIMSSERRRVEWKWMRMRTDCSRVFMKIVVNPLDIEKQHTGQSKFINFKHFIIFRQPGDCHLSK